MRIKWTDLFPTIVPNARTIEVIDTGNLNSSLILVYIHNHKLLFACVPAFVDLVMETYKTNLKECVHILSPLVAPREFFFLRYCQPLNPGAWVVVDAYKSRKLNNTEKSTTCKKRR